MERISEIFKANVIKHVNSCDSNSSIDNKTIEEFLDLLTPIILSENNAIKMESFNKFINLGKTSKLNPIQDSEEFYLKFAYHSSVLFLYVLDINKDFKNSLLTYLKEKKLNSLYEKISKSFLALIGISNSENLQNFKSLYNSKQVDLAYLRLKLKIFNKFNEICQIFYDSSNFITKAEDLTETFMSVINQIIHDDLELHFKNINEEVSHLLITFFKHFYNFFKIYFKRKEGKDLDYLGNLLGTMQSNLLTHVLHLDLVQFSKDIEFNLSNAFFLILRNNSDLNKYVHESTELMKTFHTHFNHLLIYIRTFLLNFSNESDEFFDLVLNKKFSFMNLFWEKSFIGNKEILENYKEISILELYQIFLENDLKSNFAGLINEIFFIVANKLNNLSEGVVGNPNSRTEVSKFVTENKILDKMFYKMSRDKNLFSIMDDNYFYIFEFFFGNSAFKSQIEKLAFDYLNTLITEKHRLTVIEARLFKFIPLNFKNYSLNDEKEENLGLMKNYFKYIFSKSYEKKNLSLINEYIKIFFDFFLKDFDKNFMQIYSYFTKVFPENFFSYLIKVNTKDLKYFNNIMINLEKFNKSLYTILVFEFYKKFFNKNVNNSDSESKSGSSSECEEKLSTEQKYSVLFTLLKPFKNHKRTISINDKQEILFELGKHSEIGKHLALNFSIKIKELKNLSKSTDRFLVIYLIEFIQGVDEPDKLFPIIKSLLKYNVKTSYAEFKSSVLKALQNFFKDYVEKILKILGKNKITQSENEFLQNSLKNFEFFFKFLSANIYDRPVENLLMYLEILNYVVELFETHKSENGFAFFLVNLCKNETIKKLTVEYVQLLDKNIYNKNLAYSLISLLRQSWFFVRSNAFKILKNKNFHSVLLNEVGILVDQIKISMYSLRQMDAEGSVNLFLLLLHHFDSEFLLDFFKVFDSGIMKSSDFSNNPEMKTKLNCVHLFLKIIESKEANYFEIISSTHSSNSDIEVHDASFSIHSIFIFIRNILEDLKDSFVDLNKKEFNFLIELGYKIIRINQSFTKYLLNNGVSEFSATGDNPEGDYDSEDKRLISLWCSTKYSIECLSMIIEIFELNYRTFSKFENFLDISRFIEEKYLDGIIRLMIDYKHMGAIDALKECLLKTAKILNKSEEDFKDSANKRIQSFINFNLIKEEVSSILRRSAGIPFILTTLIKSYISHDKLSTFSHNKVIEILKKTIEDLLKHFKDHQTNNADVAIHCLNILKVISDDTNLKIFVREFYDYIIFHIVDGLVNENWSIKNACMLLFSRLIKNNFSLYESANAKEKNIPSFVEYFSNKEGLKNKILQILSNEVENKRNNCNDSLILLITLFTKLKRSKLSEINEEDLKKTIRILFGLCYKNNKLFRKLLSSAILRLYGDSLGKDSNMIQTNVISMIESYTISLQAHREVLNSVYDFFFNIIHDLIHMKVDVEFCMKIVEIFNTIVKDEKNERKYFLKYKFIKFLTKISDFSKGLIKLQKINFYLNDNFIKFLGNNKSELEMYIDIDIDIDILPILRELKRNTKIPFFYKYVKNTVNFLFKHKLVRSFLNFNSFDLIEKSNEEFIIYILKKNSKSLLANYDVINLLLEKNLADLVNKLNVNIILKIFDFIESNKKISEILEENEDLAERVLNQIILIINENKGITKLVKRLLLLIPKLLSTTKNLSEVLKIIECFSVSSNQEKIRHTSLLAFEKILNKDFSFYTQMNSECYMNDILRIFILVINDEHPEIRSFACKIYTNFITRKNKGNSEIFSGLTYSNEYLMKNILDLISYNDSDSLFEFFIYLIKENLYFLKSKAELNTENKVFYYEPDNRYIDNIEIKVKIMGNLLLYKEKYSRLLNLKNTNIGKIETSQSLISRLNVLVMLEAFVEHITDNFYIFIEKLIEEMGSIEKKDLNYLFLYLRKYLYN